MISMATFHLKAKKLSPKKPNKMFNASRASLRGIPVYLLRDTSMPRHSGWEPLARILNDLLFLILTINLSLCSCTVRVFPLTENKLIYFVLANVWSKKKLFSLQGHNCGMQWWIFQFRGPRQEFSKIHVV